MEHVVTCPACRKRFAYKPHLAGRRVTCRCGSPLEIPLANPDTIEALTSADVIDAPPAAPARPTCSRCGASMASGTCTACGYNPRLPSPRMIAARPLPGTAPARRAPHARWLPYVLAAVAMLGVLGIAGAAALWMFGPQIPGFRGLFKPASKGTVTLAPGDALVYPLGSMKRYRITYKTLSTTRSWHLVAFLSESDRARIKFPVGPDQNPFIGMSYSMGQIGATMEGVVPRNAAYFVLVNVSRTPATFDYQIEALE